ncbi:hypothetical protein ACFL9U_15515, partial [Thermodesulfobacteriota bacterium]
MWNKKIIIAALILVIAVLSQPMQAYAGSPPYFRAATVLTDNRTSGPSTLFVVDIFDPDGSVMDTITTLQVIYPDGVTVENIPPADAYLQINAQTPVAGMYTFYMEDNQGLSATTYVYSTPGTVITPPDSTT